MHILIATPFYPPDISGAGRYVADIATAARTRGDTVTVLHLGASQGGEPGVHPVPPSRVRGLTSFIAVRRALAIHRQHPVDLLIAGLAHPTGAPLAILSRLIRVPLIVVAASEEFANGQRSLFTWTSLRLTFATSTHVLAVSHWTASEVARYGDAPCTVIAPAIDLQRFMDLVPPDVLVAADRLRHAHELDDNTVVLTVARLEDRKGHDTVLRAIAALGPDYDDVRYLVVGAGDQQPLRQLAASLGMLDRLTILDHLSHNELMAVYASADIFAMLSRPGPLGQVEGFGIVYLEAAICGLPCIAGDLGGCADAVIDGVTGLLVDPRHLEAVTTALGQLIDDHSAARLMGLRGRTRVLESFGLATMYAAVIDVLDSV